MIGRLTGQLVAKQPPQIIVDVGGVGYEVDVPMSTFYNLPASGEKVTLLTHHAVREDGHFLYGFGSEAERFAFRQLLKISGVGARTAIRTTFPSLEGRTSIRLRRNSASQFLRSPRPPVASFHSAT